MSILLETSLREDIIGNINSLLWSLQIGNVFGNSDQISGKEDYSDCQGRMPSRLLGA
jgi:hypothetical protein